MDNKIINNSMRALLIGRCHSLAWALPQMLARAGFQIDVITSSPIMKRGRFIRSCETVPTAQSLIPAIQRAMHHHYDWIIITDDITLREIRESEIPSCDKLKLLPVQSLNNFTHLFSKTGLSKVLSDNGVSTPPYHVAHNLSDAMLGANQIGYPLFLKLDSSSGGLGVFECQNSTDLKACESKLSKWPVLIQKKIEGAEKDFSAIFLNGDLVHFSHSKIERVCDNTFGPSVIRTYCTLSNTDAQIAQELAQLGTVLGAHGFVTISCMESGSQRYYIEADMRPNVWVEFPRFFGEDPATQIKNWFSQKKTLSRGDLLALQNPTSQIIIPYFLRLKWFELLFNRFNVWKFIPRDDKVLISFLIVQRFIIYPMLYRLTMLGKYLTPIKYHKTVKSRCSRFLRFYA